MSAVNAVIYARYSSDRQSEQSIEGQLRYCADFAARSGFNVVGQYVDRALSGTSDNRPQFQQMIRDSSRANWSIVIVWKLDRFSRNRYDSAIYKNKLKKHGVRVVSATEAIGEGTEGVIIEAMLEAMAEVYSKQLGQNAARGMRETALKGKWTGGPIPVGFRVNAENMLEIDPKTEQIPRFIIENHAAGMTKSDIAKACNENGWKTRRGMAWTINSVRYVIENAMYKGDYTFKGEIPRTCPAIVPADVFDQSYQRHLATVKRRGEKDKDDVFYILSGKLFCGYCKTAMTGNVGTSRSGERHHYYTCYRRKKHHDCHKRSERKGYIEWYVAEQTMHYILSPDRINYISDKVAAAYAAEFSNTHIDDLESKLAELNREFDRLADSLIKTTSQRMIDNINAKAAEIENAVAEIEEELAGLRAGAKAALKPYDIKKFLKDLASGDPADPEYQQRIIDALVHAVYLYDDKLLIYYNLPGARQLSEIPELPDADSLLGDNCSDCFTYGGPFINLSEHGSLIVTKTHLILYLAR